MGLDGNIEDTYTVANKVQDRYYYSSKFNSGIRDWSARMDFDYTPMPQHHIKFGAEYIHHTFRPGIATSKIQDIDNGALQEVRFTIPATAMPCADKKSPFTPKTISM